MKISILVMVIKVIKKIDTEKITKSLKKLRNKIFNPSKFKEDMINLWIILKILKIINMKKKKVVFLKTKKKKEKEKICKRFRVYC